MRSQVLLRLIIALVFSPLVAVVFAVGALYAFAALMVDFVTGWKPDVEKSK